MDADIRAAASNLERAITRMESRISELRGEESQGKRELDNEDSHLSRDIHQTELRLAMVSSNNDGESESEISKLTKEIYDLRKDRDQVKSNTTRQFSDEEKEVRSLEDQVNRLRQIMRTLESWS